MEILFFLSSLGLLILINTEKLLNTILDWKGFVIIKLQQSF